MTPDDLEEQEYWAVLEVALNEWLGSQHTTLWALWDVSDQKERPAAARWMLNQIRGFEEWLAAKAAEIPELDGNVVEQYDDRIQPGTEPFPSPASDPGLSPTERY